MGVFVQKLFTLIITAGSLQMSNCFQRSNQVSHSKLLHNELLGRNTYNLEDRALQFVAGYADILKGQNHNHPRSNYISVDEYLYKNFGIQERKCPYLSRKAPFLRQRRAVLEPVKTALFGSENTSQEQIQTIISSTIPTVAKTTKRHHHKHKSTSSPRILSTLLTTPVPETTKRHRHHRKKTTPKPAEILSTTPNYETTKKRHHHHKKTTPKLLPEMSSTIGTNSETTKKHHHHKKKTTLKLISSTMSSILETTTKKHRHHHHKKTTSKLPTEISSTMAPNSETTKKHHHHHRKKATPKLPSEISSKIVPNFETTKKLHHHHRKKSTSKLISSTIPPTETARESHNQEFSPYNDSITLSRVVGSGTSSTLFSTMKTTELATKTTFTENPSGQKKFSDGIMESTDHLSTNYDDGPLEASSVGTASVTSGTPLTSQQKDTNNKIIEGTDQQSDFSLSSSTKSDSITSILPEITTTNPIALTPTETVQFTSFSTPNSETETELAALPDSQTSDDPEMNYPWAHSSTATSKITVLVTMLPVSDSTEEVMDANATSTISDINDLPDYPGETEYTLIPSTQFATLNIEGSPTSIHTDQPLTTEVEANTPKSSTIFSASGTTTTESSEPSISEYTMTSNGADTATSLPTTVTYMTNQPSSEDWTNSDTKETQDFAISQTTEEAAIINSLDPTTINHEVKGHIHLSESTDHDVIEIQTTRLQSSTTVIRTFTAPELIETTKTPLVQEHLMSTASQILRLTAKPNSRIGHGPKVKPTKIVKQKKNTIKKNLKSTTAPFVANKNSTFSDICYICGREFMKLMPMTIEQEGDNIQTNFDNVAQSIAADPEEDLPSDEKVSSHFKGPCYDSDYCHTMCIQHDRRPGGGYCNSQGGKCICRGAPS